MPIIMRMPEVLANVTEAILTSWMVPEGTTVTEGQPIAEVETEKALVEVASEVNGVLARYLAPEGSTAQIGAPMAIFITSDERDVDLDAFLAQESIAQPASPATTSETKPEIKFESAQSNTEPASAAVGNSQARSSGRLFVSPLARKLAKSHEIDPELITGTGPDGRIVRGDVEKFIATSVNKKAAPAAAAAPAARNEAIPHSPMRKAIARRLTESKSSVPHFYLNAECNVDLLLELRRQLNQWSNSKISVNDLIVKASAAAFSDVPNANVIWTEKELLRFADSDISIAVTTDKGLVTPVLRSVNKMSIFEVNQTVLDLATRAREGRLKQHEIEGGSFSVTNLGMFGVQSFSAIINPPQSAILAVGAAKPKAVVIENQIKIANTLELTLSVDHRAIDGALAAQWLSAFCKRIEEPMWMLI
jgi:pyruvate dehydrogenase E2 component (dihydrolipoamide acetyltransferase)